MTEKTKPQIDTIAICKDCDEITLSQRECPNCHGQTVKTKIRLDRARGGTGNAGPGPHEGWSCSRCRVLWDGGKLYGFACAVHGGSPAQSPEGTLNIEPGTALGDYPGTSELN